MNWPDRIALEIPPGEGVATRIQMSYGQLESKANALARVLAPLVRPDQVVAILLPRNTQLLFIAQLAVMKARAAYTCLDIAFPDERVQEILNDSEAVVLLTNSDGLTRTARLRVECPARFDLTAELPTPTPAATTAHANGPTPESLAYVIYTSGTTGRPKGVMIEHRSIANLVASDMDRFQLTPADRVAQGSSAAYDSSVEEIWLAWAAAATLVLMEDAAARLGPDLIPWLQQERITVFCPPPTLLRATGCQHPASVLPDLKLLYVGGEALPRDVADRWSQGAELVNGYGPTECTVTCLRDRIESGGPITIGQPVRGAYAYVLDDSLEEVAPNINGELCIGGIGLARGYWRRPELTAEKFVIHPRLGRLYRTGDSVHRDGSGRFFYHGRMDSQIKLRGYRIELGEIETRLAELPGVRAAACTVQENGGNPSLVAFVLPVSPSSPPSPSDLKAALGKVLPGYMVPSQIGFLDALPTTVGGKLHRAALPQLLETPAQAEQPHVSPRTPIESKLCAAFTEVLKRKGTVSVRADFFKDLGGDSLSAAQVITRLRDDRETASLAVRDLYEAPSAASLALRIDPLNSATLPTTERPESSAGANRIFATCVQSIWLIKTIWLASWLSYWVGFHWLPSLTSEVGLIPLTLLGVPLLLVLSLLYTPLAVLFAVTAKKVLIGTYTPIKAPVWGSFYLRNWIVQRTVHLIPWWLLEGTEFQLMALRALGARIGRRVHIHRGVNLLQGGWDLLEIGDNVTLNQDVALRLVELEAGHILLGPIRLETDATLDTHASVGGHSRIGAGSFLTARSSLARGGQIPKNERWDGIPAKPVGFASAPPHLPQTRKLLSETQSALALLGARLLLAMGLALPIEGLSLLLIKAYGLDATQAHLWLTNPNLSSRLLLACIALAVLPVPFAVFLEALACRLMGHVHEGVTSRWDLSYIRIWLKAELVESGSRWLYGTLFWPHWLRLAGMKVGTGCELSTLIGTLPETIEIGAKTFCADGIYLGAPQLHRGTVAVTKTSLGQNNFIGNGAIIAAGQTLPDNVLLGVCTVAADSPMRPDSAWFGHPPFELPRREIMSFDSSLTHHPSRTRYAVRVFWELLRFALPLEAAFVVPLWFHWMALAEGSLSHNTFLMLGVPFLSVSAALIPPALAILLKWCLLGKVRPGTHPLWSSWASRWDFHCLTWNLYAARIASTLEGTLLLNVLLRTMGAKIGRGVLLGPGAAEDLADPDMMTIDDNATVDCLFQAHTFEDRVLKMDYVRLRKHATIGRNTVLLYGADIGENSIIAPNSVVMKHEHLLANTDYAGFPLRPTRSN